MLSFVVDFLAAFCSSRTGMIAAAFRATASRAEDSAKALNSRANSLTKDFPAAPYGMSKRLNLQCTASEYVVFRLSMNTFASCSPHVNTGSAIMVNGGSDNPDGIWAWSAVIEVSLDVGD